MLEYVIFGIEIFFNLFLLFLLVNHKTESRLAIRWLIVFICSIVLWIVTIILIFLYHDYSVIIWFARGSFVTTAFAFLCLDTFIRIFFGKTDKFMKVRIITGVALSVLSITPFIVTSIDYSSGVKFPNPIFSKFIILYLIIVIAFLLDIIYVTLITLRKSRGIQFTQIGYLMAGMTVAGIFAIFSNLLLPIISKDSSTAFLGPMAISFMNAFISYSVIKNRLFGIRFILAKTVGTILIYIIPVSSLFVIVNLAQKADEFSPQWFISLTFAGIIITILQSKLTKYIGEKLIPGLAYGKANPYQIKEKIANSISNVTTISKISTILQAEIQELYAPRIYAFIVKNRNNNKVYFATSNFTYLKLDKLLPLLNEISEQTLVLSNLTIEEKKTLKPSLHDILISSNIDLIHSFRINRRTNALLVLGERGNDNSYSFEDIAFIRDICNTIAIPIDRSMLYEKQARFNEELALKIEEATKLLKRKYLELEIAQKAIKKKNFEIKDALAKLTALDQAKSEFISMASHQLRTPVSIIRGYMSMFKEGDFGRLNADQIAYAEKMEQNLIRLNTIIDDILNASRIEANRFSVYPSTFDLTTMVTQLVDQFTGKAAKKGLKIKLSLPKETIFLEADKDKILETISNIIDNGINYTLKGHIAINIKQKNGSKILIEISDTGIGIPKNKYDKIFQRFARLDNAKKVRPDGTGIGLYLAKAVVEAHKGKIWFESEEGKGTTFFIEIPKKSQVTILPG